jgi:hypothetical protein
LREQYYIDILVKILSESMHEVDFELWNNRFEIYKKDEEMMDFIPNPMLDRERKGG